MKSLRAALALALMLPCRTPAAAPDWFPRADLMTIGVYYYPEAWPENQWARDMANMRKLGMEFVHMGDFAWAFMEPEEGKYQFDWLEKNVALAAQNGMKVILCTPTAAPPVWLSRNAFTIHSGISLGKTRPRSNWAKRSSRCIGPPYLPPPKAELVMIISPAYSVRILLQRVAPRRPLPARFLW